MKTKDDLLGSVNLDQFELAPSQVWGNIRLVPVIKSKGTQNLRLGLRNYDDAETIVALDGRVPLLDTQTTYYSYIPHAMVARWSSDDKPVVPYGCQLQPKKKRTDNLVRVDYRMAKKEGNQQIRFLPLHLAMEGFLGLCFGGPDFAWSEYSQTVLRHGLGSRSERSIRGHQIEGLSDALRVFEIHRNQVGVLVFVSDALASCFIVSHPHDYHKMHASLLEDFYGELLYYNGQQFYQVPDLEDGVEQVVIDGVDELYKLVRNARGVWENEQKELLSGILDRPIRSEIINRLGPYLLQRFMTDFDNEKENYIGEAIVDRDGGIEYLKTFQLSRAQSRRAYLLQSLSESNWNLDDAAVSVGCDRDNLIRRLDNVGFGYLLKPHVLEAALRK